MIANFLVHTWTACFLDRRTNIPRLEVNYFFFYNYYHLNVIENLYKTTE